MPPLLLRRFVSPVLVVVYCNLVSMFLLLLILKNSVHELSYRHVIGITSKQKHRCLAAACLLSEDVHRHNAFFLHPFNRYHFRSWQLLTHNCLQVGSQNGSFYCEFYSHSAKSTLGMQHIRDICSLVVPESYFSLII